MGLSNPVHIGFVLVLLLLVFGAKRLPEIGRSLGSGMRGFKDSISGEGEHHALSAQPQQPAPAATNPPAPTSSVAPVEEPVAPFAA